MRHAAAIQTVLAMLLAFFLAPFQHFTRSQITRTTLLRVRFTPIFSAFTPTRQRTRFMGLWSMMTTLAITLTSGPSIPSRPCCLMASRRYSCPGTMKCSGAPIWVRLCTPSEIRETVANVAFVFVGCAFDVEIGIAGPVHHAVPHGNGNINPIVHKVMLAAAFGYRESRPFTERE